MTPRSTLAFVTIATVSAFTAPLAAESQPVTAALEVGATSTIEAASTAMSGSVKDASMASVSAQAQRSPVAPLDRVKSQANVLNWNNDFTMIDSTKSLPSLTQARSGKMQNFALEILSPDFGDPETLSDEYPLAGRLTIQPRTPVRQATGAEFEQTYAFAPTTNANTRLDGDLRTVGRATNVRLRF